jgi:hypothetical protein
MNCSDIKEFLEEYINGELSEDMEKQVAGHLEGCSCCMKVYEELKEAVSGIRAAYGKIEVPEELKSVGVIKKNKEMKWFSYKRMAALAACILTIFIASLITTNFLPEDRVSAGDYRGGFSLVPQSFDSTGVNPDSKYTLKSLNSMDKEEVEKALSIDGEPKPVVTKENSKSFTIAPSREFDQNRLYTFRIKSQSGNDIVWTFQTRAVFKIVSAFPADKTTDVPSNTGIEIYFSHEDFEDPSNYFEISPPVKGKFERHKSAAVFVPDELAEGTLYTVKVKSGLKLKGTIYSLNSDYVFQFETGSKDGKPIYEKGNFNYNKILNEYSPDEKPYIPLNYYVNQDNYKGSIKVSTTVYGYNNMEDFISDIGKREAVPNWAYRSSMKNIVPVQNLNKVLQFEQKLNTVQEEEPFIKLPDALPAGYYIVDSKWEDINFQTFIEVTDIGMYMMRASNKTIIWLNDLKTKQPITGAVVAPVGENTAYYSDSEGLVSFDTVKYRNNGSGNLQNYFKITTEDNKTALLNGYYYTDMYSDDTVVNTENYWNLLQLDRNLYKPDDTVNFWGFVKDRYSDEKVTELTVEIGQGYRYYGRHKGGYGDEGLKARYYMPLDEQPMVKQTVYTENGVFKGSIKLPVLDPGGYQLTLKKGKKVIANSYINIENYVKPPYKIEISKDKKAVFPGQPVNFNVKAAFFEGTGVPDLSINYDIGAYSLGENQITSSGKTDSQGNMEFKYIPNPAGNVQGEQYVGLNCRAMLPEIGETYQNDGVKVFVNDINVKLSAHTKGSKGFIKAELNKIVLDRLNNGTAKDDSDYLGEAVIGKDLEVTVFKNTWIKIEDGQYYDYINKVTQKRYRYEPRKEAVKTFTMKTGNDGIATYEFDVPALAEGYYSADVACKDNSGRNMKFDVYAGNDGGFDRDIYDENRYYLDGGKEKYNLGETVGLTFKKGKKALPHGKYLFIKTQNGIREFVVKDGPGFSFDFEQKDVPNVHVTGVYFNGLTYVESEQFNAVYDYKEKNLVIDAKLDKEAYKPGDEVVIDITAKDKSGAPRKAVVNVSLVDEALFKLNDQNIDTLMTLYNGVSTGIETTYQSHVNSGREMMVDEARGMKEKKIARINMKFDSIASTKSNMIKMEFSEPLDTVQNAVAFTVKADETSLRQDFKDAVHFVNVTLDDSGHGRIKFRLPDNITAWRVTLSGVTSDLSAGSGKVSLNVSLPFFINYTMNSTYLVGDKPVLGVNAYGNDLVEGQDVAFEVTSLTNPDRIVRAQGKAFERIDIPLWEMKEGTEDIVIMAQSSNGLKDSIKQTIKTVKTYHQAEKAQYYDLKPGIKIEGGESGNTRLVFSDSSRGALLPELTNLLYTSGNRVDQKLSQKIAAELINRYFEDSGIDNSTTSFKVTDYQRQDGGIALLPYGNSYSEITSKLVSLIKDDVNVQKLKEYFYSILLDDSPGLKGNALYGLAVLREPVLLNLDKAAGVENVGIKDLIYIALAYCELGDLPKAARIYNERILPEIEEYKPFYRLNTGKDNDDILECTALAAVLASKLDKPQKKGLYRYCMENSTKDILINVEKLLYITEELKKSKDEVVEFSYSYNGEKKTRTLKNGESYIITVPSKNLSQFKVESVKGSISLVSIFTSEISGLNKPDTSLTVERQYSQKGNQTNSFKQGDIVKVEITWDIGNKAIDGQYEITDYLPSGLKPIDNPYNAGINPADSNTPFKRIDGQKVTFYVSKGWEVKKPLVYYARIVNPGTYKAESTIIQCVASKEAVNTGKQDVVTIK